CSITNAHSCRTVSGMGRPDPPAYLPGTGEPRASRVEHDPEFRVPGEGGHFFSHADRGIRKWKVPLTQAFNPGRSISSHWAELIGGSYTRRSAAVPPSRSAKEATPPTGTGSVDGSLGPYRFPRSSTALIPSALPSRQVR